MAACLRCDWWLLWMRRPCPVCRRAWVPVVVRDATGERVVWVRAGR